MKKILSATCAMMLASAGMMANAQQLPNGNFDGTWVDCKPDGSNVVGVQPVGWMASSVYKNYIMEVTGELVYQDKNREQSVDNAFSVRMENLWVGVKLFNMGANAPGYITLGTSWAYGDVSNVGKPNDTSDGGSYGGVQFKFRPDALSLWVKRTHGTEKPNEKASVVFYSWKGQTTSRVKTGLSNAPVEIDMVDREKDVLGMIQDGITNGRTFPPECADHTGGGDDDHQPCFEPFAGGERRPSGRDEGVAGCSSGSLVLPGGAGSDEQPRLRTQRRSL